MLPATSSAVAVIWCVPGVSAEAVMKTGPSLAVAWPTGLPSESSRTIEPAGAATSKVGVVSRVMPSPSLIPVSLEARSTGVTGAGGVVSRMKLNVTGAARLPLESVASRVSVCLPSASGPPLIVAIIDGVRVNVVPLRSPSTLTTGDWSICAWNETIGLTVVMLPVTVSSEVMLSSAETPVSSARPAERTGGVRLRPGWTRVIVRVDWLVTPAALVATTVKVLPPSATGTSKKANRPLAFDCRDGPGRLESHGQVGVGLADQGHGGVGRRAAADRRGGRVDVEVERPACAGDAAAEAVVAWKP